MNTVATTTAPPEPKTFRELIQTDKYRDEIGKALPPGVTTDRVQKIVLAAMNKQPDLLLCTPISMYQACVECATLNLWPGPQGHMYLIPRNNKVTENGRERWEMQATAMIGYRGMIEMAYRSNLVVPGSFVAQPIHESDHFEHEYGHSQRIVHRPKLGNRGEMIGAWAGVIPKDGVMVFHVMSKEDVDKIRARSKAKGHSPWQTDYNEMACKTVVRRLWKYLPSSVIDKFAEALERDAEREFDLKEVQGLARTELRFSDDEPAPPAADQQPPTEKSEGKQALDGATLRAECMTLAKELSEEAQVRVLDSFSSHSFAGVPDADLSSLLNTLKAEKGKTP